MYIILILLYYVFRMKYYVSKANKNNIELVVKDLLGKYVFTCKSYYAGKRYSENITINIKSYYYSIRLLYICK